LAIDFERNGQHMYEKLAAEVMIRRQKSSIASLKPWKKNMKSRSTKTMRYLQDPGNYMINAESWTME
jgi:hypothetical protein